MKALLACLGIVLAFSPAISRGEPINFDAAYAQGVNAFHAGRYVLAEECLEDAVSVVGDPRAWMVKGLTERALGKHGESQESIHQAASLMAAGVSGSGLVGRVIERTQGGFRRYVQDVVDYYARTNRLPGDVIVGSVFAPIPVVEPIAAPPEAVPPAAVPVAPAAARDPVVVLKVIDGAPVYPIDSTFYGQRTDSPVYMTDPIIGPCCGGSVYGLSYGYPAYYFGSPWPVSPYVVGVGAWVPAWYTTYTSWWMGSPYYAW